jgi:hypothetical protein
LDIHSFAFRYSCYSEFGWDTEQVARLPEPEALRLAVVFEETGAYQYKKNKELDRGGGGGGGGESPSRGGLQQGYEEIFSFGENDDTDYLHFKDDGVEIVD